ncbi:MAG: hypothetical protein KF741_12475 [Ferruginibacter sp.]|nr:hypothetical protein [Bacteroidota bacterium]MBX2920050.1 hypothetical protein [Ferruginibacter sp.]MCC7379045.1 hypothetical protein [Chitinophagaceae bacterium]
MTNKQNIIALLISSVVFVSCAANDNTDYTDKSIIPEGKQNTTDNPDTSLPTTVSVPVQPTVNTINTPSAQVNTLSNNQPTVSTVTTQAAPEQNKGSVKLNPPHGQPGHRCDIAVGAPLDSKPGSSTTAPTIVTTQQPAQATNAGLQQQKTAPGMNPPHGQPGHRCDIAVGAPLNSKPAPTPVAVPAEQGANDVQPLQAPVKPDTSKG